MPLLSEFREIRFVPVIGPEDTARVKSMRIKPAKPTKIHRAVTLSRGVLHAGMKILAASLALCVGCSGGPTDFGAPRVDAPSGDAPQYGVLKVGVFREPEEFFEAAKCIKRHRFDEKGMQDPATLQWICDILTKGPTWWETVQTATLDRWDALSEEFAEREAALHGSMQDGPATILEGKKLELLRHILYKELRWPDTSLVDDLVKGMPLVGDIPRSAVFQDKEVLPTKTVEDLWAGAKAWRGHLNGALRHASDRVLAEATVAKTYEEVALGNLRGPYSEDEGERRWGPGFTPARRFTIEQGVKEVVTETVDKSGERVLFTAEEPKLRAIDDLTEPGSNAAAHMHSKVHTDGVDEILGLLKAILESFDVDTRVVKVTLPCGRTLLGRLSDDWTEEKLELVAALVDLVRAYRQIPGRPSQQWANAIVIFNVVMNQVEFFEQLASPFGGSACVFNFNRVSRALWAIMRYLLGVLVTVFFDDFSIVSFVGCAGHTVSIATRFFKLLGWAAEVECAPTQSPTPLGVELSLTRSVRTKVVKVLNQSKRMRDLRAEFAGIRRRGECRPGQSGRLRGKVGFTVSQHYGRAGRGPMKALTRRQYKRSPPFDLEDGFGVALDWFEIFFEVSPPRQMTVGVEPAPPLLLFTDGWQGESLLEVGVSAVLFVLDTEEIRYMSEAVPFHVLAEWLGIPEVELASVAAGSSGAPPLRKTVINQAELLPQLLARSTLGTLLRGQRLISSLDSNTALGGLIGGYSRVQHSAAALSATWLLDASLGVATWYSRVPSFSNPADEASRFKHELMEKLGAVRDLPVWPQWFKGRDAAETVAALRGIMRGEASRAG